MFCWEPREGKLQYFSLLSTNLVLVYLDTPTEPPFVSVSLPFVRPRRRRDLVCIRCLFSKHFERERKYYIQALNTVFAVTKLGVRHGKRAVAVADVVAVFGFSGMEGFAGTHVSSRRRARTRTTKRLQRQDRRGSRRDFRHRTWCTLYQLKWHILILQAADGISWRDKWVPQVQSTRARGYTVNPAALVTCCESVTPHI
jgi:hypothetical protein